MTLSKTRKTLSNFYPYYLKYLASLLVLEEINHLMDSPVPQHHSREQHTPHESTQAPPRMDKMENAAWTTEQNPQSAFDEDEKKPLRTTIHSSTATAITTAENGGQTHDFRRKGTFWFFIFVYVAAIVFIGQKVVGILPLAKETTTPQSTILPAGQNTSNSTGASKTTHTCGMLLNQVFTPTSSPTTSTLSLFIWSLVGWIMLGSLISFIYVMVKCVPSEEDEDLEEGQVDGVDWVDEVEWVESKKREIELL